MSVIIAIALQTIGLVMWGTTLTNRVSDLEKQVSMVSPIGERSVRLEEQMRALTATVGEIRDLVRVRPTRPAMGR